MQFGGKFFRELESKKFLKIPFVVVFIGTIFSLIYLSIAYWQLKNKIAFSPQENQLVIKQNITTPQREPSEFPQEELKPEYESTYSYPYPVAWRGGNINYSLVKATIGYVNVPYDALLGTNSLLNRQIKDKNNEPYPVGSKVYAVILYVKASESGYNNQYDPKSVIRRLINEEGDTVKSSIEGISSGFPPYIEEIDGASAVEIWFLVPENKKDFTFVILKNGYYGYSGEYAFDPLLYFGVKGQSDRSVEIENYAKNQSG